MSQYVEVRPLPIKKWHQKEGKESFAQPKVIEALYNDKTGKYATGLTEEEAAKYGKLIGADLSDTFSPTEAHPFWSSKPAQIKLENRTMLFDTSKPINAVLVKLMKAHRSVANSMREYEEQKWPDATHVIYDEQEETSMRASKVQLKQKATIAAANMTSDDKISMAQILSSKSLRGRSNDFIDVEIYDIIETQPEQFLKYVNMGREEVGVRSTVLELIYKNILTKEGSAIYYMGDIIGLDYEEAVKYFKDPQNSRMKVAILEKLNK